MEGTEGCAQCQAELPPPTKLHYLSLACWLLLLAPRPSGDKDMVPSCLWPNSQPWSGLRTGLMALKCHHPRLGPSFSSFPTP